MYIVYNLTKQSEMTLFHKIDPSLTSDNFYGLIWSEITLNFNPWQNYESKHMHIWYISTNWPDLTPIGRVWPKFDLWWFLWPNLTWNNFELQSLTTWWVETYVYLIYFDQPARFDPYWTGMTQVRPLMTLIDLEKYEIWIIEKILSRKICILDTFLLNRPIWP